MFNELFWMAAADAAQGTTEDFWGSIGIEFLVVFAFICVLCFILVKTVLRKSVGEARQIKRTKKENIKIRSAEGAKYFFKATYPHLVGLDLPENVACMIQANSTEVSFKSGGREFTLQMGQITDISLMTAAQLQTQMTSSVGGAIAGAMMFGAVGAIVGGAAKKRKIKTTTNCLVITYQSNNGEIRQILFDATANPVAAKLFITETKGLYSEASNTTAL